MLTYRLAPIAALLLSACSQALTPAATSSEIKGDSPEQISKASTATQFQKEVERSKTLLSCGSTKTTPASGNWGALFGCISGPAETVKFFINEEPGTGKVSSVKFLWNDWFKNRGYGIHADSKEADKMLRDLIKLYPSEHDEALLRAFKGSKNVIKEGNGYRFEYTFDRGPAIDERMIVVTPITLGT
ncbi:hypothetical protein ACM9XC_05675 [Xanthomonas sacchari]